MKKPLLIVIVIVVVILFLPLVNMIRWTFQAKKPMNVVVLDKTVPTLDRVNHRSFMWVLTNERFVKKEAGGSYSFRKDYYGFFPKKPMKDKLFDQKNLRLTETLTLADKTDAIYYADTYGIFFNDWYRGINKSRRSRRIYGGLNNNDYLLIAEMKKRDKLIVLEYNTFDYPTADLERYKTEAQLGIKFTGWTGRYLHSLDTVSDPEFPIWMTSMYRKEYRKPWTFSKPGVVFLKGSEIIVLEEGTHLKSAMPVITSDSVYTRKYNLGENIPFDRWFDVIDPQSSNIVSNFNIETTSVGDTLLFENFLSNQFPAVITDNTSHRNFYFSGDFASNNVPYWISRFKGIEKLKGILYSEKQDDSRRFFWLYYRPLINGIFSEYYDTMNKK